MPSDKKVVAVRLDDKDLEFVNRFAKKLDVSQARVLGIALQLLKERMGQDPAPQEPVEGGGNGQIPADTVEGILAHFRG